MLSQLEVTLKNIYILRYFTHFFGFISRKIVKNCHLALKNKNKNFPKLFIEKCRKFNAALKSLAYFIDSTQIKAHINNSNKLAKLRHSTHTRTHTYRLGK